jgi:hypothetical protein
MPKRGKRLTLDQPVTYEIRIPGVLDFRNSDWAGNISLAVEEDDAEHPITILTREFDQAALHGLLRRLYAQGLPIISVRWVEDETDRQVGAEPDTMEGP